jgi:hypothetical protein
VRVIADLFFLVQLIAMFGGIPSFIAVMFLWLIRPEQWRVIWSMLLLLSFGWCAVAAWYAYEIWQRYFAFGPTIFPIPQVAIWLMTCSPSYAVITYLIWARLWRKNPNPTT